jgi:catechol 2,3-dioxygenase-like lactoylglutathione lyase family enzyme
MLDHVTIGTSDLARAREFYDRALKPLGIDRLYAEGQTASGYGADKKAFFWISARDAVMTGVHVAFAAPDHATVDAFHAAALAAGGETTAHLARGRIIIVTITVHLSSIWTATTSRRYATFRLRAKAIGHGDVVAAVLKFLQLPPKAQLRQKSANPCTCIVRETCLVNARKPTG